MESCHYYHWIVVHGGVLCLMEIEGTKCEICGRESLAVLLDGTIHCKKCGKIYSDATIPEDYEIPRSISDAGEWKNI